MILPSMTWKEMYDGLATNAQISFFFTKCFPIYHQESLGNPLNSAGPHFCVVIPTGFERKMGFSKYLNK